MTSASQHDLLQLKERLGDVVSSKTVLSKLPGNEVSKLTNNVMGSIEKKEPRRPFRNWKAAKTEKLFKYIYIAQQLEMIVGVAKDTNDEAKRKFQNLEALEDEILEELMPRIFAF